MKKILITGANSFIGTSFENYIKNHPKTNDYEIATIDTLTGKMMGAETTDEPWNFGGFDTVFHVAGIAHADVGKVSEEGKELYRKVNTELTIETAKKAKAAGVKQFIFMSSAIVYGASGKIGHKKEIGKDTPVNPENFYGESKVNAENGLRELESDDFKIVILRPPMIYGPGCKGNYNTLRKMAIKMPLFPKVDNERSMLYIDNLCEFVRLMIDNEEKGIFWPANKELTNTSEMVKMIGEANGKKVRLISGFTWAVKIMSHMTGLVNKAFGNLTYDAELTEYKCEYRVKSLANSIVETEITLKTE